MKNRCFAPFISFLALCALAACGKQETAPAAPAREDKLQIVTTIAPEYDWVREILGDEAGHAELTLLLDNGVDLHSYQPTAEDLMKIAGCDLFIHVGGESDAWMDDALQNTVNPNQKVISLLAVSGSAAKEEETVEGMQAEDKGGEETEYDEHVWLSLRNARLFCSAITDALSALDPEHAAAYQENAAAYQKKLSDLDTRYQEMTDKAKRKILLFGDRFPFRYLTDDYGLSYYAAFAGCSAETEASFETITFLAGKVDEWSLPAILTLEKSDQKIAKAILENTEAKNQKILTLDSLQSAGSHDLAAGTSYLSVMESNLSVLEAALN